MKPKPPDPTVGLRRRSRTTRWLHLLLATLVVHQMIMSTLMQVPNAQHHRAGNLWWQFHEVGGLSCFVILLLFWVWSMARGARETRFGDWFPWFSSDSRAALWHDVGDYLRTAMRLRLPVPGAATPLASAVQGIGLLLVSVLAATGTLFWVGAQLGGDWPARVHWARQLHGALGNLVWYYLTLHAGAAVIHVFFGHRVLKPMAPLGD